MTHWVELRQRGVELDRARDFESALRGGRGALQRLGIPAYEARERADRFRRHNVANLDEMLPFFGDERRLSAAKAGREQLESSSPRTALPSIAPLERGRPDVDPQLLERARSAGGDRDLTPRVEPRPIADRSCAAGSRSRGCVVAVAAVPSIQTGQAQLRWPVGAWPSPTGRSGHSSSSRPDSW